MKAKLDREMTRQESQRASVDNTCYVVRTYWRGECLSGSVMARCINYDRALLAACDLVDSVPAGQGMQIERPGYFAETMIRI